MPSSIATLDYFVLRGWVALWWWRAFCVFGGGTFECGGRLWISYEYNQLKCTIGFDGLAQIRKYIVCSSTGRIGIMTCPYMRSVELAAE